MTRNRDVNSLGHKFDVVHTGIPVALPFAAVGAGADEWHQLVALALVSGVPAELCGKSYALLVTDSDHDIAQASHANDVISTDVCIVCSNGELCAPAHVCRRAHL